jgi:hypothetical protein
MRLTYFAGPGGRAEPARLALSAAGIEFEDVRVSGPEEWAARKPTTPSGALPLLEVGQTTASLPPRPSSLVFDTTQPRSLYSVHVSVLVVLSESWW